MVIERFESLESDLKDISQLMTSVLKNRERFGERWGSQLWLLNKLSREKRQELRSLHIFRRVALEESVLGSRQVEYLYGIVDKNSNSAKAVSILASMGQQIEIGKTSRFLNASLYESEPENENRYLFVGSRKALKILCSILNREIDEFPYSTNPEELKERFENLAKQFIPQYEVSLPYLISNNKVDPYIIVSKILFEKGLDISARQLKISFGEIAIDVPNKLEIYGAPDVIKTLNEVSKTTEFLTIWAFNYSNQQAEEIIESSNFDNGTKLRMQEIAQSVHSYIEARTQDSSEHAKLYFEREKIIALFKSELEPIIDRILISN